MTLEEVKGKNFKVAFIDGNRGINETNVKLLCKEIHKIGMQHPILFCFGTRAAEEGYKLVDINGNEAKPDESIVILDGQHRYIASTKFITENGRISDNPKDNTKVIEDKNVFFIEAKFKDGITIKDVISSCNYAVRNWKSDDFIMAAALKSESEAVKFAAQLYKEEFKSSTIGLIITGTKLSSAQIREIFDTGLMAVREDGLETAKKFYEVAKKVFEGNKFIRKRYLIEAFNAYKDKDEFLNKLQMANVDDMIKSKSKEDIISMIEVVAAKPVKLQGQGG